MRLVRSIQSRAALFVAALVTCLIGLTPLAAPVGATTAHYYLAIGDSYPFGYQPDGNWSSGYTDQLLTKLKQSDPNLSLVNMACWGETTDTLINGNCLGPQIGIPTKVPYTDPAQTQLGTAVSFLQAHGSAVKLVTVDVGLNDVAFQCFDPDTGAVDYACVSSVLPTVRQHEVQIINTLKAAASPSTKFITATSLDPLQNAVPDTIKAVQEFNVMMASVAVSTQTPIALIGHAFHLNQYPNGNNPYLCPANAPLLWVCINGDTHPTTLGYTLIANTYFNKYQTL